VGAKPYQEEQMKKVFSLVSMGVLFAILGCSGNSQKAISKGALPVVHASTAPANASSPVTASAAALPEVAAGESNGQTWHSEDVKDLLGNGVVLKKTSIDGKFDLVILQKGTHSFVSFVKHSRWESVHDRPAKGKLMNLRVRFENGEEKRIEWDELGFATADLCSVLWSYPAKTDAPIGPVLEGDQGDSVGGDELFIQDMMKHKAMLLEVEAGVMTQFDVTGLALEIEKARTPKTQAVLEAKQTTN
jgi:hypothetical protein